MPNYVFKYLGMLFKFIFKFKKFIPGSVAGVFLVWEFFTDLNSVGLDAAMHNLSKSVLACEIVINENVHLAIENSFHYGIGAFLEIVTSVFILYTLFILLIKFFKFLMSSDIANFGAYVIAALVIFVIEYYSVRMLGHHGFIPFWDGIIFLALNSGPVFGNIFGPSASTVASNVSANVSSNSSFFSWFS